MTYDATHGVEEKLGSLFQPDTLVPAQYFDNVRRKANSEPEKKLMLMILEEAVDCFQKYIFVRDAKGKTIFAAAEQWLMEKDGKWIFSLTMSVTLWGLTQAMFVRGCCAGRK